jgi:hypothetical protein
VLTCTHLHRPQVRIPASGNVLPYPCTYFNTHAPHAFGAHHNPTYTAMAKTSASAAILEAADWCKDYRQRYHNEDPTPGNNASVQARENGVAASQGSRKIRQDKGDLGTKNSDNDDQGSAPFRPRPCKCSADPLP